MIQELRTLLINDRDGSNFILIPRGFSYIQLSQIESRIRSAILGNAATSLEYKCYIADRLFNAIYRDSEYTNLLSSVFDNRVYLSPNISEKTLMPEFSIISGGSSLSVDMGSIKFNKQKILLNYLFTKNTSDVTGKSILVSGGVSGSTQVITLNNAEIASGSSWKVINDSDVAVKFYLGDGLSEIPNNYRSELQVSIPFEFDAYTSLNDLLSTQGLIDFMYLIGQNYPEILQKFLSDDRVDRRFFAIIIAYGISVKRKSIN